MQLFVLSCLVAMSAAYPKADTFGVANEMRRHYPNGPEWMQKFDVSQRRPTSEEGNRSVEGGPIPRRPLVTINNEDTSWMFDRAVDRNELSVEENQPLNFPVHHKRRPALPTRPYRQSY